MAYAKAAIWTSQSEMQSIPSVKPGIDPRAELNCRRIASFCSVALLLFGGCAELGWAFEIPVLKSIIPGFIAMNPTTALLFILAGTSLIGVLRESRWGMRLVWSTSALMVAVGGIKDMGYLLGDSLPVDRLLFWSKLDPGGPFHGNAIASNTALCLVFAGLALPRMASRRGPVGWATASVLLSMSVGFAAFIGYAFAALTLNGVGAYAPMALPVGLCFVMLAIAAVAFRPAEGIAKLFTQTATGSVLTRRVLPVATLIPVVVGIVRVYLERESHLSGAAAGALAAVATMAVVAAIILMAAGTINATDLRRQEAERELVQLTDRLRALAVEADDANQAKSEFLANMSHEIRTPLNGVLGMLFILERSGLSEEQAGYTKTIRQSADALLAIINDVIDVSKIEAGKMTLEEIEFDPKQVVVEVERLFVMPANEKGISLNVQAPWGVPCTVLGDPVRFRQIVTNLVSNAIKFTKVGRVTIDLAVDRDDQASHFVLGVSDTGVGIPQDRLANIFESFTQADGTTTRQFGGSGLGLTITRQLVQIMGGEITVTSQLGRGSRFEVRFSAPTVGAVEASLPFAKVACLLVEPYPDDRLALIQMLEGMGARVSAHASFASVPLGQDAIPVLLVGQEFAVPMAIRERAKRKILLVPLGNILDNGAKEALGADAVLFTPAAEAEVIKAVLEEAAARVDVPEPKVLEGVRVLLAEDNLVNQIVAGHMLEEMGATVTMVENGSQAVQAAGNNPFDVILMDCHMPTMDGFEAASRILTTQPQLPIVALTASSMDEDRRRCEEVGMAGYILKPVRLDDLRAAILHALHPTGHSS